MIKCPYCKNINVKFQYSINSKLNNETYDLFDCPNCYLTFYWPLKFEDVYNDGELYNERHTTIKINAWNRELIRIIKKLNINLHNKKILDIGASNCVNYQVLKQNFNIDPLNYYALELDTKALEIGKNIGVINIINEYFNHRIPEKINQKFDIIIATEVLEHQTNPREFLDTANQLLTDNGILIITVPNKNRLFLKLTEQPNDVPPHHFLKLSKKFFKENFNVKHINTFYYRTNDIKGTSINISKKLKLNEKWWWLMLPLTFTVKIYHLLASIKGDRIIVILNKKMFSMYI